MVDTAILPQTMAYTQYQGTHLTNLLLPIYLTLRLKFRRIPVSASHTFPILNAPITDCAVRFNISIGRWAIHQARLWKVAIDKFTTCQAWLGAMTIDNVTNWKITIWNVAIDDFTDREARRRVATIDKRTVLQHCIEAGAVGDVAVNVGGTLGECNIC